MELLPALSRVGLNDFLKHHLPAAVEAAAASLGLAEAGWGPGGEGCWERARRRLRGPGLPRQPHPEPHL